MAASVGQRGFTPTKIPEASMYRQMKLILSGNRPVPSTLNLSAHEQLSRLTIPAPLRAFRRSMIPPGNSARRWVTRWQELIESQSGHLRCTARQSTSILPLKLKPWASEVLRLNRAFSKKHLEGMVSLVASGQTFFCATTRAILLQSMTLRPVGPFCRREE